MAQEPQINLWGMVAGAVVPVVCAPQAGFLLLPVLLLQSPLAQAAQRERRAATTAQPDPTQYLAASLLAVVVEAEHIPPQV